MVCKYSHDAGYEQRYGIDELGGFQPCSSRMQRGRIFMLVRSKFIVICFALSSECDLRDASRSVCYSRNCLSRGFLLHILRVFFSVCILRDAFLRAFFEMSLRLCVLRDALMCASVEVPCYVHPSRCFDVGCAWGVSRKTSPPF